MSRVVAVFGGSFNPPHVAHVLAAAYVLAACDVERVLVVPAFRHPFHGRPPRASQSDASAADASYKELAPFEHRVAMARLAFADLGRVEVSEIERELGHEVSRTLDTLEALAARHSDWRLRLVIGADVLGERDKWHRWDRIADLAPPIVLGRASVTHAEAPPAVLPDVSSSAVRDAIAAGDETTVARLVPRRVRDYLATHALYRCGAHH